MVKNVTEELIFSTFKMVREVRGFIRNWKQQDSLKRQ
jgi:hypothetical protein